MARLGYSGVPDVSAQTSVPNDTQEIRASPGAFGEPLAEGGEALGQGLLTAAKFYGTVAADNATNNTLQQVTSVLYGDPSKSTMGPDGQKTGDTGYFGLRGADAMRARPDVSQQIDEIIKNNREGLETPIARLQYDQDTRRQRANWLSTIGQHSDQQQRVWSMDTNNTTAQLALAGLARSPLDDNTVTQTRETVRKSMVRNAQLNGEDAGGAVLKADQQVDLKRWEALLPNNPQAAQKVIQESSVLGSLPNYDQLMNQTKTAVINSQLSPAIDQAVLQATNNARASVGNVVGATGLNEQSAAASVQQLFPGAQITSQQRTPGHNAAVGGVSDSMHIPGQAIDFVPPKGTSLAQVKSALEAKGLPASELLDEGTHIHWGWGAKPSDGGGSAYPSIPDAINANMDTTLAKAQTDAEHLFPNYPDAQERYVTGVERRLNQVVSQQRQQYEVDTHVVQQAMEQKKPISEDQLVALGPQVASAWQSTKVNNPYAAMSIDRMFDANAHGSAKTYGTQFNSMLERVLSPNDSPEHIGDSYGLWNYVDADAREESPLTNTGVNTLSTVLSMRSGPNGEANAAALRGFAEKLHDQMTFSKQYYGLSDPNGERMYEKSLQAILPALQVGLKNGKTVSEMVDPKSPDYVGKLAVPPRSPDKRMSDIMSATEANALSPGNRPVTLAPQKASMVEQAVASKQLTEVQGEQLKGLMLDVQANRLTQAQARQRAVQLGIFPPPVPGPQ